MFLQTQDRIPRVWRRYMYIDDIFAICDHGEPSLRVFKENINRHNPNIKFTALWEAEEVTSLDTRVHLTDGKIGTDLQVKPMDTHQDHQIDSCHPQHCKSSIPYSQALCLWRICLEKKHLQKWTRELKKHLLKWGYREQQLNKEIHRALTILRENCLQIHPNQEKSARIPLVVTYHPILPPLQNDHQAPPLYPSFLRTA